MYILLLFSAGKRRPTSPSTKPQQRCSAGLSGRVKWCHYDRLWPEGHIWSGLPHHCHGPRKLQGQNLRPVWKFQQWRSRWVPAARWKRNQELADVRRGVESARPRSGLWRRMQRWPLPQMWHFWKSCVGGEMWSYHQSACHAVIAPNSYFRDCVYDICMAEGDQDMLCHSIAAYMLDCQDFGAKVQNWRSPSFCRESSYFYNLLYTVLSTITPKKTLKCPVICVQLLRVVPAAIMRHVCCLVPLHVLVCLTPSRAPRAVWRAVPVITATTTMELAACPLTSVAAITTAKLTRWENISIEGRSDKFGGGFETPLK